MGLSKASLLLVNSPIKSALEDALLKGSHQTSGTTWRVNVDSWLDVGQYLLECWDMVCGVGLVSIGPHCTGGEWSFVAASFPFPVVHLYGAPFSAPSLSPCPIPLFTPSRSQWSFQVPGGKIIWIFLFPFPVWYSSRIFMSCMLEGCPRDFSETTFSWWIFYNSKVLPFKTSFCCGLQ